MRMRLVNAGHEDYTHWKLSQVSLQYITADVTDNNILDVALEAIVQVSLIRTCLSPETDDVCGVHMAMHKGV